jgi:hypothetical protein
MQRRLRPAILAGALFAALVTGGCLALHCWCPPLFFQLWYSVFPPPQSPPESWVTGSPEDYAAQWQDIPKIDFRPVAPGSEAQAIQLLTDSPVVELDADEVPVFAPGVEPRADGARPYLVRAVLCNGPDGKRIGTGNFTLSRRGNRLRVLFGYLGFRDWGQSRAPLVVWLPFKPEAVSVELQSAV